MYLALCINKVNGNLFFTASIKLSPGGSISYKQSNKLVCTY